MRNSLIVTIAALAALASLAGEADAQVRRGQQYGPFYSGPRQQQPIPWGQLQMRPYYSFSLPRSAPYPQPQWQIAPATPMTRFNGRNYIQQ